MKLKPMTKICTKATIDGKAIFNGPLGETRALQDVHKNGNLVVSKSENVSETSAIPNYQYGEKHCGRRLR